MGSAASATSTEEHETLSWTEISLASKNYALQKYLLDVKLLEPSFLTICWKIVLDFTSLFYHMLEGSCIKTCLKQSS